MINDTETKRFLLDQQHSNQPANQQQQRFLLTELSQCSSSPKFIIATATTNAATTAPPDADQQKHDDINKNLDYMSNNSSLLNANAINVVVPGARIIAVKSHASTFSSSSTSTTTSSSSSIKHLNERSMTTTTNTTTTDAASSSTSSPTTVAITANNNQNDEHDKIVVDAVLTTTTTTLLHNQQPCTPTQPHPQPPPPPVTNLRLSNVGVNISNKGDPESIQENSIITSTNGDHPYCNLSKLNLINTINNKNIQQQKRQTKNRKTNTTNTNRKRRQTITKTSEQQSQSDQDCLIKKILLQKPLTAPTTTTATSRENPLAIVPIKVDLSSINSSEQSKILLLNDSSALNTATATLSTIENTADNKTSNVLKLIGRENLVFELNIVKPQTRMSKMVQNGDSFGQPFFSIDNSIGGASFQPIQQHKMNFPSTNKSSFGELMTMENIDSTNWSPFVTVDAHNQHNQITSLPPVQTIFNDQANLTSFGQQNKLSQTSSLSYGFDEDFTTPLNDNLMDYYKPDYEEEDNLLKKTLPYGYANGYFLDEKDPFKISSSSVTSSLPSSSATSSPVLDGTGQFDLLTNSDFTSQQNTPFTNKFNSFSSNAIYDSSFNSNNQQYINEFSDNNLVVCNDFDPISNQQNINPVNDGLMRKPMTNLSPIMMNGNQELTLTQLNSTSMLGKTSDNVMMNCDGWPNNRNKIRQQSNNNFLNMENICEDFNSDCIDDESYTFKTPASQQRQNMFSNVTENNMPISSSSNQSFVVQDSVVTMAIPHHQICSSPNIIVQGQSYNQNGDQQQRPTLDLKLMNSKCKSTNLVSKSSQISSEYFTNEKPANSNQQQSTSGNFTELSTALISNHSTTITTTNTSINNNQNVSKHIHLNSPSQNNIANSYTMNNQSTSLALMNSGNHNNNNNRIRNNSMSTDISSHDEGFASQPEEDFDDNSDNNSEMTLTNNNNSGAVEMINISEIFREVNNDHHYHLPQQQQMPNVVPIVTGDGNSITTNTIQLQSIDQASLFMNNDKYSTNSNDNVWTFNDATSTSSKTSQNKTNLNASRNSCYKSNLSSIDENEESDDDDDDDESFYGEYNTSDLIGATISDDAKSKWSLNMGRSRKSSDKRYFWQYNVQSKGPKGPRFGAGSFDDDDDPHVFNETTDPVFAPDCQVEGVKHSGKARRGDGNDLTANPRKLLIIGLELKKLGKIINDLTPVTEVPQSSRNKSRKEKNKLASRACRLKKKAQHEANKIKLHGLKREHGRLIKMISLIRSLIDAGIKVKQASIHHHPHAHQPTELIDLGEHKYPITTSTNMCLILNKIKETNTTKYDIAGKTADFVNRILENVTCGMIDGGLDNY